MSVIKEYTELYLFEFSRLRKDFLKKMLDYKGESGNLRTSFIDLCKDTSLKSGICPLPLKYYNELWIKLCNIYDLNMSNSRYDSFLNAKAYKEIPKDFPFEEYKDNKEKLTKAIEEYNADLENLAFLSYYLDHPLEVSEEIMGYLISVCDYNGSFGADYLKKMYVDIVSKDNTLDEDKKM